MKDRNFSAPAMFFDAAFTPSPPGSPKPTCFLCSSGSPTMTLPSPQVVAAILASAGVLVKPIATCCLPSAASATTLPLVSALFGIAPWLYRVVRKVSASTPGAWLKAAFLPSSEKTEPPACHSSG